MPINSPGEDPGQWEETEEKDWLQTPGSSKRLLTHGQGRGKEGVCLDFGGFSERELSRFLSFCLYLRSGPQK